MGKNLKFLSLLFLTCLIFSSCTKKEDGISPTAGEFTINGTKYTGSCNITINVACPNPSTTNAGDVVIANTGGQSIVIFNMPKQQNGSFSIKNGLLSGDCDLTAVVTLTSPNSFSSISGSLTKTGSRSFNLNMTVEHAFNNFRTTVTASGTY